MKPVGKTNVQQRAQAYGRPAGAPSGYGVASRQKKSGGSGMGTLVIPGSVCLVAGGPNPGEAGILIDHLVGAEVERRLMDAGFCQISLRGGGEAGGALPGKIKPMDLTFGQIYEQLHRMRRDITEVFLR